MPDTPDYSWPPMDKRRVMGKRHTRMDGRLKATGRAKYASDVQRPGMLYGVVLTCPYALARLTSIDTSEAEKMPGVMAVEPLAKAGDLIQYAGYEVAALAATSEQLARDAIRRIKVQYEPMPHVVDERDLSKVGARATKAAEWKQGDPDQAFKDADVISDGFYGIPVLDHCCMESHGQVIEWKEEMDYWPSTQFVSGVGPELAKMLEIPATNIHAHMEAIGGGFGSKFGVDRWGEYCAKLSKKAGGRAVKLFLDRATELAIAGNRPSLFANVRIGAKKDGTITVWQSQSWATGGVASGSLPPRQLPYVLFNIPNQRFQHTAVQTNAAGQRAWRAPNQQQLSYVTCCAMEDAAARLHMDPIEFFTKNMDYARPIEPGPQTYKDQLAKAAELAEWKKLWHPRGESGSGTVKRGMGIGFAMWAGLGHESHCHTIINPDGTVAVEIGSQDLGTGTRTIIAMVAAETLGLPADAIKVNIGDNKYPFSSASGGSTTVGGVSAATRKSTMNALVKLFEAVAPALGAPAGELEAVDSKIRVKGNPAKSLSWADACRKLGVKPISEMGENTQRGPGGLINRGVGGIQIADVSVDTETGIVKMNRLVAVHDCGLVVNPKTAESQIYGACIMNICGALMEERILDNQTGRMLNKDLEFYKLAGIGDIGEIVAHLEIFPERDSRGVIGLGEPPAIGGIAAIANAVTNAIGVRPPVVPLTPDKVLRALERRA